MAATRKRLKVVYILSSTYDDEGYVLRYWRGILPSNTLCVLKSLTEDVARRNELGDDVELTVEIYDDTVMRIPVQKIAREHGRNGTQLLVGFVGVQSNQFARASDLALEFRKLGVPVVIGGFHVSGILAMFGSPSGDLQRLLDAGVSLVKGEAESPGALAGILRDALHNRLEPIYEIPNPEDLGAVPIPRPDKEYLRHFKAGRMATLDTSRGCPFNCSFCTIINVQGRRMRSRSADCVLRAVEENYAAGIDFYFFTDDNFSRSPIWEQVLDGMAALRRRGMDIRFMMQVDTRAHLIPGFAQKAREAGCYMAFIGMETVNPANLEATGKVQNDAADYPAMVEAWHEAKVLVHVGYIIGLPYDTRESVRQDIDALMHTMKVDEASFFMLTPLPGSRDHYDMVTNRVPVDADLNNFDSLHETFRHPRMAPGEWQAAFRESWETFYDQDNMVDVMLRTCPERYWHMLWTFMWYRYSTLRQSHPMFTGLIRLKDRKHRRPIFPREGRAKYAWRRIRELYAEAATFVRLFFEFQEVWLLTRKPQDPRWATLADLRAKWADAQQRIRECGLRGRYDEAAQAAREMLSAASERLRRLSEARKSLGRGVRKRLQQKAQEAENYLRKLEAPNLTWQHVQQAERYVREHLLAGYEELAIRYVANRRRLNEYRHEVARRIKSGRLLTINVSMIPRALLYEIVLGTRFLYWFFTGGRA